MFKLIFGGITFFLGVFLICLVGYLFHDSTVQKTDIYPCLVAGILLLISARIEITTFKLIPKDNKSKKPLKSVRLTDDAVKAISDLQSQLEVETPSEAFLAAVRLLGWFLDKRKNGYEVAIIDKEGRIKNLSPEDPRLID